MEHKSERRVALLSGTPGFTLPTVIRLLAAEWEIEAGRIEEALWRDFHAGEFDPPPEALANYNAAAVEPSTDFACCWETFTEYVDLLNETHTNTTPATPGGSLSLHHSGYHFGSPDEDTIYDRTIIPEGAIVRFCTKWGRPAPAFLKECDIAPNPSEEESPATLTAIGLGKERPLELRWVEVRNQERTQRLGNTSEKRREEIIHHLKGLEPKVMERKDRIEYIQKTFNTPRDFARKIASKMPREYKFGRGEKRSLLLLSK
jgi:hypothetical protein